MNRSWSIQLWITILLVSWAVWIGGLTFYAAVVVPIGGEMIGETGQGLITQQVTVRLNVIGALTLAVWMIEIRIRRRASRLTNLIWLGQGILLLVLVSLHVKLSSLISEDRHLESLSSEFYQWHRAYLIGTTIQWALGLALLFAWVKSMFLLDDQDHTPAQRHAAADKTGAARESK